MASLDCGDSSTDAVPPEVPLTQRKSQQQLTLITISVHLNPPVQTSLREISLILFIVFTFSIIETGQAQKLGYRNPPRHLQQ